jgi:hypothetical protein
MNKGVVSFVATSSCREGEGVKLYLSVSDSLVSMYIKFECNKFCFCLSVVKRRV